ncbi:sensor histidine kinase [Rhodopirellula sp. MGV]|uniref:sensor histidine kinase n=1 Tax=Rhodopirellula sp. MGV TaxID=2023130 RepID=UPI000B95F99F|nr:HAMP domain-containing sensor histidine kinase [Rhodopirellula sp. MGV]OYP32255.1 hypothetical protein CGZ80_19485 [Rhodopirellula sp. MGV]PNY35962.1 sensor histidine kinase [Rhodopirellula baltica]
MPRPLFLALLSLVVTPIVLLGWLSASAARQSEIAAKETLAALLSTQLVEAQKSVHDVFRSYADQLDRAFELDPGRTSPEIALESRLRQLRRSNPIVRQGFIIGLDGDLVFPTELDLSGRAGAEVAATLSGILDSRPQFRPVAGTDYGNATSGLQYQAIQVKGGQPPVEQKSQATTAASEQPAQWQQWYMGDGAQVLYWRALPSGPTVGVLLERSRWMSDLIAALPDDDVVAAQTSESGERTLNGKTLSVPRLGSVRLVDEAKRSIYRWGDVAAFDQEPLTVLELDEPLPSWQLQMFVDPALTPGSSLLSLYLSLAGIGILLLLVGVYVLTSVRRQIVEARSRVTFAGQVSHELRTPLTNIRLYTELAELDLAKLAGTTRPDAASSGDTKADESVHSLASRLQVIDHEGRRLQRLVSGVLEMIRPSGKRAGVRRQQTELCPLLTQIAHQFEPSFETAGLTLNIECQVDVPVMIDPDVFELVLVNLLSNVEKYVPSGGRCLVECELMETDRDETNSSMLVVTVSDDGPGIGRRHRKRVFEPFERLDDSISAPSGTGIGLTISKRAATRHGGDLELLAASSIGGAAFRLTLAIDDALLTTTSTGTKR